MRSRGRTVLLAVRGQPHCGKNLPGLGSLVGGVLLALRSQPDCRPDSATPAP
jgi:hypothetical protein